MWRKPRQGEAGQGMVEFALIAGFLTVLTTASFLLVGPEISEMYEGSVTDDMLDYGQAGISSMLYVAATEGTGDGVENWGTYEPDLSVTSVSLWNQPVGTTRDLTCTIDESKLSTATSATLGGTLFDIDFQGEVKIYVNGQFWFAPGATGDQQYSTGAGTIPLNLLQAGNNTITVEFADDNGPPATQGFDITNIELTLTQ